MANGNNGGGGGMSLTSLLLWLVIFGIGGAACWLAWQGWTLVFDAAVPNPAIAPETYLFDKIVRTVKVLLMSDIYYDPSFTAEQLYWFVPARSVGILFTLMVTFRLIFLAIRSRMGDLWFRFWLGKHHVILGDGAAAKEYANAFPGMFEGKAVHIAAEAAPKAGRVVTYERRGDIWAQLRQAKARVASRIIVDAGEDADTWQIAQQAAGEYPDADVLAHIRDPWIRDRLSRDRIQTDRPTPRLTPFTYATGVARQVMLAHPPYLLAQALEAKAQHILIVGFGQVGESIAREFLVTSVVPEDAKMMITVVDPDSVRLEADFRGRHKELMDFVDFDFIDGDFRLADTKENGLFASISKRTAKAPICAVYVAIDLEHEPLGLAFAIRAMALRHGLFSAPIFVCAQHGAGLQRVRQGVGIVGGSIDLQEKRESQAVAHGQLCNLRVVSFGSWRAAFDGVGMLEDTFDAQAKRYHDVYSANYAEAERRLKGSVSGEPTSWANLPDQLRVSNRRAAAHMRAKAHAVGYDVAKWLASGDGQHASHELPDAQDKFPASDEPDIKMARLEHERWVLDRFLDGWRAGGRSNYFRMRPTLVPFDQLKPDEIAKDNAVVQTTRKLMEEAAAAAKKKKKKKP